MRTHFDEKNTKIHFKTKKKLFKKPKIYVKLKEIPFK